MTPLRGMDSHSPRLDPDSRIAMLDLPDTGDTSDFPPQLGKRVAGEIQNIIYNHTLGMRREPDDLTVETL